MKTKPRRKTAERIAYESEVYAAFVRCVIGYVSAAACFALAGYAMGLVLPAALTFGLVGLIGVRILVQTAFLVTERIQNNGGLTLRLELVPAATGGAYA